MTSPSTTSAQPMRVGDIRPVPTAEEAAAIVAALELMWPRASAVSTTANNGRTAWRFSGRWWAAPLAVSRARPQR